MNKRELFVKDVNKKFESWAISFRLAHYKGYLNAKVAASKELVDDILLLTKDNKYNLSEGAAKEIAIYELGIKWATYFASLQIGSEYKNLVKDIEAKIKDTQNINQLAQHKPTEEQRLQALKDMANTSKDKMIQGIADYETNKYNRDNSIPRQIEMPPLEINRSEHKAVNLFWDTLESIYIPNK